MDVDQDLREFQRQYLDFLDDDVSVATCPNYVNEYQIRPLNMISSPQGIVYVKTSHCACPGGCSLTHGVVSIPDLIRAAIASSILPRRT